MARIVYTTCGTSLYTSNCWASNSRLGWLRRLRSPDREQAEAICREHLEDAQRTERDLAGEFDMAVWNDLNRLGQLPAELASLRVIQRFCEVNNPPGPLNANDKVILIHADDDKAKFCARTIHRVMVSHNLLGNVNIEKPQGIDGFKWVNTTLDPYEPQRLRQALEKLWLSLQDRMPRARDCKYFLNITGGYKILIMLFACFGYEKSNLDTHIFYLNEESGSDVLVLGFDRDEPYNGFRSVKTAYIEGNTGYVPYHEMDLHLFSG